MNERLERYVTMRATKPIRNIGDCIHAIHTGTEFAAELRLTDLQGALAEIERLRASERSLSERIVNMSDQYETLHAEFERLRADNARLESAFSDCAENAEAWHQKAERLRALLVLARTDLSAAKQLIEADQLATAYGIEQTVDKINDAIGYEQTDNTMTLGTRVTWDKDGNRVVTPIRDKP